MSNAPRDAHPGVRPCTCRPVVVVTPREIRVCLDRRNLGRVGADLVGGHGCGRAQDEARPDAVRMSHHPLQHPHAPQGGSQHQRPGRNPQRVHHPQLDLDHVGDSHHGEAAPPGRAVGRQTGGTRRTLASAQDVGAHDEPLIGVDRCARTHQAVPPSARQMAVLRGTGDVGVTRQCVTDIDGVVARGVKLTPCLVGHPNIRDDLARCQGDIPDVDEHTSAWVIPLPPRTGGGRRT